MKPYKFVFQLPSQIITSGAGAGSLALSAAVGGGGFPITAAKFLTYPSTNGLANFYDLSIATEFKLADVVNYIPFTNMFDAYRLDKVSCSIEYLNNVSAVNSTGLMPSLYTYWDQDDAVIPSIGGVTIQGKQGVKRRQFGNNSLTSLKTSGHPKLAVAVENAGAGVTSAIVQKAVFLDCVSPSVAHYALKMFITDIYLPGSVAVTQAFRFNWTYHLSFRAPLLTT